MRGMRRRGSRGCGNAPSLRSRIEGAARSRSVLADRGDNTRWLVEGDCPARPSILGRRGRCGCGATPRCGPGARDRAFASPPRRRRTDAEVSASLRRRPPDVRSVRCKGPATAIPLDGFVSGPGYGPGYRPGYGPGLGPGYGRHARHSHHWGPSSTCGPGCGRPARLWPYTAGLGHPAGRPRVWPSRRPAC
jgi:hypothetical protein